MKIQSKRLLRLADFLDTVPRSRLRMGRWTNTCDVNLKTCGTVACAFGWACTIPYFRRLGLKITDGGEYLADKEPTFKGETGYAAAEEFFQISYGAARFLFSPHAYKYEPRPTTVANRIRRFVKDHQTKEVTNAS